LLLFIAFINWAYLTRTFSSSEYGPFLKREWAVVLWKINFSKVDAILFRIQPESAYCVSLRNFSLEKLVRWRVYDGHIAEFAHRMSITTTIFYKFRKNLRNITFKLRYIVAKNLSERVIFMLVRLRIFFGIAWNTYIKIMKQRNKIK